MLILGVAEAINFERNMAGLVEWLMNNQIPSWRQAMEESISDSESPTYRY